MSDEHGEGSSANLDRMMELLQSTLAPGLQMQGLMTVAALMQGAKNASDLGAHDITAQLLKRARALLSIMPEETGPRPALEAANRDA